MSSRRGAAFALIVVGAVVGACSSPPAATGPAATVVATPGATAAAPTGAASAVPPSAAATQGAVSPESLSGTWVLTSSNARVISASGDASGGTITLSGGRYEFKAGDYRSEGPNELDGTVTLECTARGCRARELSPLTQLIVVDDQLRIGNPATLDLFGVFGGRCGWPDIPDGGVIKVVESGDVNGQTLPTVVKFVAGASSGFGTDCSGASWVAAWDVTATRQ